MRLICVILGLLCWAGNARAGGLSPTTSPSTPAIAAVTTAPTIEPTTRPTPLTREDLKLAIARGVAFLEKSQQPDGSWGTGRETHGLEVDSMVPGSLESFHQGTTALAVMALREAGSDAAAKRGIDFLCTTPDARRDDGSLLYNTWAHIFVLQAAAEEIRVWHNSDPRVLELAKRNIKHLTQYATYLGGWNYYDFDANTQQSSMGPTSFGTAAGLVALFEAKAAGLEVPQPLVKLSVDQLEKMRLPGGVFSYGEPYKYLPRLPANRIRGAIGRTQPANFAIGLWDPPKVPDAVAKAGLDAFFANHIFLEMGRKRPIPHEAWYQTAGYYYYFDHYYAARLIKSLPAEDRPDYFRKLAEVVAPHQEPDGSWWDFVLWDFHKPYGTAFAVMTLERCLGNR